MPKAVALQRSGQHNFSKESADRLNLIAGVGVEGDAHAGPLVQHRSRVAVDPGQPNLRQVHLIASKLFAVLAMVGHTVTAGELGENVTTEGLDVHALAVGALLLLGDDALVVVTGLRSPCAQIDRFQAGLLRHVAYRTDHGVLVQRAAIMGVVVRGGTVTVGDTIAVSSPPGPSRPLERV